jgi:uncharacterized membrane protein YgdD (TMEM256/DUF423 family)
MYFCTTEYISEHICQYFSREGNPADSSFSYAGYLALGGNMLFSGSLYALVLTGIKKLGAITPIGGLMYIGAWVCLAFDK